ncbi:MAG TPA: hypothetical protein VK186_17325 [Candidatus Deferrimicrobium sp.]|nr:hypothetical protein [Candidatus Kapabacteria bacterium]HLP60607.1 hypothetical protein [Candidatus Deferrimicrobium sp.]
MQSPWGYSILKLIQDIEKVEPEALLFFCGLSTLPGFNYAIIYFKVIGTAFWAITHTAIIITVYTAAVITFL